MELKIINYLGKTLKTKWYCNISDDKCAELKRQYYEIPIEEDLNNELIKIFNGGSKMSNIVKTYFKDLMAKTKMYHSKWSIEEMFKSNDLIRYFYARTLKNDKLFPREKSDISNFETILRLGGKGVCSKPSNFPIKHVREILELYNINGNYYDFSCGWGVRLLGSLSMKINYFGTDPNYILVDRLKELSMRFNILNNIDIKTDIRANGSEIFIPEWENKIGVAFSSPPYFNLEDYKIGNQSVKKDTTYNSWLKEYFTETIKNIYKYLTSDGYLILNVNDYDKYKLVYDMRKICEENGFELYETHGLKNIKRTNCKGNFNDNSEDIMVFKKRNLYILECIGNNGGQK